MFSLLEELLGFPLISVPAQWQRCLDLMDAVVSGGPGPRPTLQGLVDDNIRGCVGPAVPPRLTVTPGCNFTGSQG